MLTAVLAGCGAMSSVWLEAIQKIEGLTLVGLVDVDIDRARQCAERFNLSDVVVGTSLNDVLVLAKPDIVFDVAVPQARRELVTTAFEHGCDVLTEKPMALSLEDAQALVIAARTHGRIHAVVQNRRYLANVRRIRRFLDLQVLGKPTSIHCDFFLAPHFGGFREKMDHVLLVDMAIHTFDAARYMANAAPESVYCVEWEPANSWYQAGSSATALFKLEGGIVFNYRGSWCAEGFKTSWESNWRIVCELGTLIWDGFDDLRAERATATRDGIFAVPERVEIPPLQAEDKVGGHLGVMTDFVNAVRKKGEPETAGSDNIKSLAMVFAAVESANTGKLVDIRI
jgi:predicted dehydrogenase